MRSVTRSIDGYFLFEKVNFNKKLERQPLYFLFLLGRYNEEERKNKCKYG